jgi:hypothetical protein
VCREGEYRLRKLEGVREDVLKQRIAYVLQGGSNMTGTNCDLFTHKSSRPYLNHLVF